MRVTIVGAWMAASFVVLAGQPAAVNAQESVQTPEEVDTCALATDQSRGISSLVESTFAAAMGSLIVPRRDDS